VFSLTSCAGNGGTQQIHEEYLVCLFDWCRSQNAKPFVSRSVSFSSLHSPPPPLRHTSLSALPTESRHFFSAPTPSLLNSSPLFPPKVFVSFCYRSGPYSPPPNLLISFYTPRSTPLSTHSFSFLLNYNLSFFPKASNACSAHPTRRQQGWRCGTALQPSSVAKTYTLPTLFLHSGKLFFFYLY
jgi:hypothetical protein